MVCLYCGVILTGNSKTYCSRKCQNDNQYNNYVEKWKAGKETGMRGQYNISAHIRRYMLEKYDGKCCICGWNEKNTVSGKTPLEVHHVDGDYTNNTESNVILLCPNCHSLTDTYKSLNKNGRDSRY